MDFGAFICGFFLSPALRLRLRPPRGFDARLPQGLSLVERLLERFDQAVRIGSEPFVRQAHGVASRKRPDRFGQVLQPRYPRLSHQHRDHPLILLQGRLDLDTHEIIGIVDAAASVLVQGIEPARTDHCQQHITLTNLLFQHPDKVQAGCDAVDIHE
jgi:hypothetical protein